MNDSLTEDEHNAPLRQQLTYWRERAKRDAMGEQLTALLLELQERRNVAVVRSGSVASVVGSDSLEGVLARRCYSMSEPHLSGYRLVIGFETLPAVQAAHEAIVKLRMERP